MIQIPELPGGKRAPKSQPTHDLQVDISRLDPERLLALRARIDERLPKRLLKDLNLEEELVIQLQLVQQLQRETAEDMDASPTQKASTAGQVASTLVSLAKLQSDIYKSERLKRIEQVLIDCITKLPMEAQREFVAGYEKLLEGV